MGGIIGKTMEENFKKQQEFMEKNQEIMVNVIQIYIHALIINK